MGFDYNCNGAENVINSSTVRKYYDADDIWSTVATGGTARHSSASFVIEGFCYIVYGNTVTITNDINQYNTDADEWIIKATEGGRLYTVSLVLHWVILVIFPTD